MLRLSHRGYNVRSIAAYTGRSPQSVGRDLGRWEERGGFAGLADGTAPGNPARITEEVRTFMEGKHSPRSAPGTPPNLLRLLGTVSG